jgi:predicted 3-demethylubiquinone-9 3-methyltransferase (glyoxalase superfamily)
VAFYTSVFRNSRVLQTVRCGDSGPGPKGSVLTITFELAGQRFMALNGGPTFKFTEAISLMVSCDSQAEIDEYWAKLTANGGSPVECGWLKDRYGLSWQIVPAILPELLGHPVKGERVLSGVAMVKLDIKFKEARREG